MYKLVVPPRYAPARRRHIRPWPLSSLALSFAWKIDDKLQALRHTGQIGCMHTSSQFSIPNFLYGLDTLLRTLFL
jgi:hypothetical protein